MNGKNHEGYRDPTATMGISAADRDLQQATYAANNGIFRASLRLPPSVNHYYFTTRDGKRLMTPAANLWMEEARWTIKTIAKNMGWKMTTSRKTVLALWVYWPDNRRRDVSNLHKALCDAPEKILYNDDRDILVRDMDYQVDRKCPRVEIAVMDLELAGMMAKEA